MILMTKILPRIEKYELQVERCPEHEHVVVQFDFGYGTRRQRMANRQ